MTFIRLTLDPTLGERMENPSELDLIKLLQIILRDGVFEIHDFEESDVATGRIVARALNLHLIRDDSTGWDSGARYVLTNDGRRALGLKTDWWMPEDLRGESSSIQQAGSCTKETSAYAKPLAIRGRFWRGKTLGIVSRFALLLCLIVVLCCLILFKLLGSRTSQPPLNVLSSRNEEY